MHTWKRQCNRDRHVEPNSRPSWYLRHTTNLHKGRGHARVHLHGVYSLCLCVFVI